MAPRNNKDAGSSSNLDDPTNHSSPYFVHPSDGPSSVTVSPVLDGSNYHSWARSMRRALSGKMKPVVLKHPSKMQGLRENINSF